MPSVFKRILLSVFQYIWVVLYFIFGFLFIAFIIHEVPDSVPNYAKIIISILFLLITYQVWRLVLRKVNGVESMRIEFTFKRVGIMLLTLALKIIVIIALLVVLTIISTYLTSSAVGIAGLAIFAILAIILYWAAIIVMLMIDKIMSRVESY